MTTSSLTVTLNLETLRPRGTEIDAAPESWLHAAVEIDGVSFNLDAIAVHFHQEIQYAEADEFEEALDHIGAITSSDKPFATVRLNGRDYVLVLTPSGS